MKHFTIFALGVAASVAATQARAAEQIAIHLHMLHQYRDANIACSGIRPGDDVFFWATVEGDRATRVVLSNHPYEGAFIPIYKAIALSAEELAGIRFFVDEKGRRWLKRISFSKASLRWIYVTAPEFHDYCRVPSVVTTIDRAPSWDFETDDINEGILLSYSQKVDVSGLRSDGATYSGEIRFSQRRYQPAPRLLKK